MNYCGDTEEDWVANEAITKLVNDDDLEGIQRFIAIDYFKDGWEAAMEFVRKKSET
jgi:hypothetical protein